MAQGYELLLGQTARPLVFLMIDVTDHISGKAGISPTVLLSKNGAAFGSPSGAVTEIGSGWYKVAGNAIDTGTLGPLVLHATGTGCDPTDMLFRVVAYDPDLAYVQLPPSAPLGYGGNTIASPGYTIHIEAPASRRPVVTVKVGDTGITIKERLRFPDGTPIDLTGKTVTFIVRPTGNGLPVLTRAATIVQATDGDVAYTIQAGDITTAGNFFRQWKIIDSGGGIYTYPENYTLPFTVTA